MEKNVRFGWLLDFYGAFLTERQRLMLDLYFNQDLSLAEIAEQEGVSRQAVRDALQRGEALLNDMEQKLGLMDRYFRAKTLLSRMEQALAGNSEAEALLGTMTELWEEGHGV